MKNMKIQFSFKRKSDGKNVLRNKKKWGGILI